MDCIVIFDCSALIEVKVGMLSAGKIQLLHHRLQPILYLSLIPAEIDVIIYSREFDCSLTSICRSMPFALACFGLTLSPAKTNTDLLTLGCDLAGTSIDF